MNQAVADRIGDTRLTDGRVPGRRRQLTRHERGFPFTPIFNDLQEVSAFRIRERREEPIVDRQEIEFGPCTASASSIAISASSCRLRPDDGVKWARCRAVAVGTLLWWYRSGVDPGSRLLQLSTFLGHVNPQSTAVYLTITTDLLTEARQRFERWAAPLVDEGAP
jgi:hypothetical protein